MTERHEAELDEIGLMRKRNVAENVEYYKNAVEFFKSDAVGDLTKLRSFSVYTPRQVISDFLARYELFKQIRDVQGSVVEFGVFAGQGLMSFAHFSAILEPNNLNREIIGFDTFTGFPDIQEQDSKGDPDILKPGGLRAKSTSACCRPFHCSTATASSATSRRCGWSRATCSTHSTSS